MILKCLPLVLAAGLAAAPLVCAAEIPAIAKSAAGGQLIVHGKPFLILGGELGNSSAGTAAEADTVLPHLAQLHVNTALIPVAWDWLPPRVPISCMELSK